MKRLFVSIEPPESATRLLVNLNPSLDGVRWLGPDQMHLTLSFLGNVSVESEARLRVNLTEISWKAFFLPIIGMGKFPSKGSPKVLWIGVGAGHPHLFQLRKRVQEAALGAGIEPDLRSFHPHVTLARCRNVSEQSIRPLLKSNAEYNAGMIHVESFHLNSSQLTPDGSVYTRELLCPCSS